MIIEKNGQKIQVSDLKEDIKEDEEVKIINEEKIVESKETEEIKVENLIRILSDKEDFSEEGIKLKDEALEALVSIFDEEIVNYLVQKKKYEIALKSLSLLSEEMGLSDLSKMLDPNSDKK